MLGEHLRDVHLTPRVFLTKELKRAGKIAKERNERAQLKAKRLAEKRAARAAQGLAEDEDEEEQEEEEEDDADQSAADTTIAEADDEFDGDVGGLDNTEEVDDPGTPVGITAADFDDQDGAGPSGITRQSRQIVIPALDDTNISSSGSTHRSRPSSPAVSTSTPVTSAAFVYPPVVTAQPPTTPSAPVLVLRKVKSGHLPVLPVPATSTALKPSKKLPGKPSLYHPPEKVPQRPSSVQGSRAVSDQPPRPSSALPAINAPTRPGFLIPDDVFAGLTFPEITSTPTSTAPTVSITSSSINKPAIIIPIVSQTGDLSSSSQRPSRTSGEHDSPSRSRTESGSRKRSIGETSMAGNISHDPGEPAAQRSAPPSRSSSRHGSPSHYGSTSRQGSPSRYSSFYTAGSRIGSPADSHRSSGFDNWSPTRYSTRSRTRSPSRSLVRTPSPQKRPKHIGIGKKSSGDMPPSTSGAMGPPTFSVRTRTVSFSPFLCYVAFTILY
jgi:hypothetical protein